MATAGAKESICKLVSVAPLKLGKADLYPTGLLVSGDMLMVTDRNEWKIWLYRHQEAKLLASSEKLESEPRGICLINNMEICVTFGNNIEIMSLQGAGDTGVITRVRTLHVNAPFNYCSRIVKCMDKVVVCGRNQDYMICWCIVSLTDGHVDTIHQISKGSWSYLASKHNMIYISCATSRDSPDNGVYGYDIHNPSKQTFIYKHEALMWPSGITVDTMGFIFVANYFPPCIHHVTTKGELMTIFREGMPSSRLYDIFCAQGLLYGTREWKNSIIRYKTEYSLQQEDYKAPADSESNERKQPASEETSSQAEEGLEDREQSSEQIPEISEDDMQGHNIPPEILRMNERSFQMYKEALQDGIVKVYNIRVMVVGQFGVGKTTLTKRLLGQQVDLSEKKSTEGIDVYKHHFKVSLETGEWIVQHEDSDQVFRLRSLLKHLTDQDERNEVCGEQKATPDRSESDIGQEGDRTSFKATELSPAKANQRPPAMEPSNIDVLKTERHLISKSDALMDFFQSVVENADKLKKSMTEYSALAMWDFAGQYVFNTTHQTFLTSRAIYLLVTDLSQEVTGCVGNDECYFDTEGAKLDKIHELVEVWLNSIHCCASPSAAGISLTCDTANTPVTSPSAGTPLTSPSTGTPVTSPSADISVTSPSPDAMPTAIGTTITSPSADSRDIFPPAGTTMTSPSFVPLVPSTAAGTPVTFPKPGTAVTSPAAGTSVTSPDDDIAATPPVILIGTHVDKIPENKRQEVTNMYYQQILSILKDKPILHHLVGFISIDNTQCDPHLETLKKRIFQLASKQPYWGEEVPATWILFEEALMKLKAAGEKVISFNLVVEINQASSVRIRTTDQLKLFLRFLHEKGSIIYFSVEGLSEYIVLDPQWLIDAQKSLITAEMFIDHNYPDIKDKWNEFREQGKLTRELIDAVWTKENNRELHNNKELVLKLLEQLNIIAKPRKFTENGEEPVDNYFLAPCMLHRKSAGEVSLLAEQDLRIVSTSVLCYVFTGKFLPPPIFHRLIAACVARWPVAKKKEKETSENIRKTSGSLIFCGCCVFDLDLLHRLTLHCRNNVIFARITGMDEFKTPPAKLCTRVRRFITLNISKIISSLDQNLTYELRVQCPSSHGVPQGRVSEDGVPEDDMVGFSPPFQMWFEYEGHDPDAPITPEHMNHARLCVALVTICGNAMREILLTNFPVQYQDIYQAILANQVNLTRRQGRPLLNTDQIQLVFPDLQRQSTGKVDQFDLSLLYILIRNVSTVPAPVTGWGSDPQDQPRDNSLGASVERIRSYRNHISGHSPDGRISKQDFDDYWTKIDAVIHDIETVIGRQVYSPQLEQQKRQVISIYEAC